MTEDVVELAECKGHSFHRNCIAFCYEEEGPFLKCPICNRVYGTRVRINYQNQLKDRSETCQKGK